MSPFSGVWVANLEKSRRHANHRFQSAALTVAVSGDEVTLTHSGVNMSGKTESGTTTLLADGVERPLSEEFPGIVVVARWLGTHVLESEAKNDGASAGKGSYAVSEDGQTLIATVAGIDAAGAAFEQVIVFERLPGQP